MRNIICSILPEPLKITENTNPKILLISVEHLQKKLEWDILELVECY